MLVTLNGHLFMNLKKALFRLIMNNVLLYQIKFGLVMLLSAHLLMKNDVK